MSVPAAASPGAQPYEIFSYRASKDGRPVVILRGLQAQGALGLTIEAEVHPADGGHQLSVLRRPYRFASRDQAHRFVEEALLALEYLGCSVVS